MRNKRGAAAPHPGPPVRVAYVVVMFPCYSETFVLREMRELLKRGAELTVLSLRDFSEKIVDEEARPLLPRTRYAPYLFSRAVLAANLRLLLARPRRYLGSIAFLAARLWRSPVELAKTAALFPKTVLFARILEAEGVRHVHAHFANYPATAAFVISRLTGIPFTATAHAHDIFQSQLLLGVKVRLARRVFAISEYNRRFILDAVGPDAASKVEVLHCGLDLGRLPSASPETGSRMVLAVAADAGGSARAAAAGGALSAWSAAATAGASGRAGCGGGVCGSVCLRRNQLSMLPWECRKMAGMVALAPRTD